MFQLSELSSLLGMFSKIPFANRNLIVDGNKDVWSSTAAGSILTTGQYTNCVMCAAGSGTGGAATYGAGAWASAPGNPTMWGMQQPLTWYGNYIQTTASTGAIANQTGPFIGYAVENVMACEGQSFTLSVWLWVNSGSVFTIPQVYVVQGFGSGGSPSANVNTAVNVNWAITSTPQRFSVRLDVPSITGKVIGTTTNGATIFRLALPVGVTFNLADAQWQLEKSNSYASSDINGAGGNPTAFEYRGMHVELARVQRNYYVTHGTVIGGSGNTFNGGFVNIFLNTMRGAPAISATNVNNSGYSGAVNTGTLDSNQLYVYPATNIGPSAWFSFLLVADSRL